MERTHIKVEEINKQWYWSIFEGVPPLHQERDWFVCSEPYDYSYDGFDRYGVCFRDPNRDRYFKFLHTFRDENDITKIQNIINKHLETL